MTNGALHELFHDLVGTINGISLMSQMCVQFIEMIKSEGSSGNCVKLREEAASNFRNIGLYYERAHKELEMTIDALDGIKSADIGDDLKNSVKGELDKVKGFISNSKDFNQEIVKAVGGQDLSEFSRELGKIEPACNSMVTTINLSKKKLIEQGKY